MAQEMYEPFPQYCKALQKKGGSLNHKLLVSRNTLPSCQIATRLIRVSRIIIKKSYYGLFYVVAVNATLQFTRALIHYLHDSYLYFWKAATKSFPVFLPRRLL